MLIIILLLNRDSMPYDAVRSLVGRRIFTDGVGHVIFGKTLANFSFFQSGHNGGDGGKL